MSGTDEIIGQIQYSPDVVLEKPDLTVVFYTDIAASCVPVYANQTWSFLHMILSTGPQSLVNFVPVSPIVFYLHVYPFYVY